MIKLEKVHEDDTHYYTVMGWISEQKISAPKYNKKFNIFEEAKKFYNRIYDLCGYVEFLEVIDGKRKIIATSDEDPKLENFTTDYNN